MPSFAGFPSGKVHHTPIPAPFFDSLLPQIDHLAELKVTLYVFWFLNRQEGPLRHLTRADFLNDRLLMEGLDPEPEAARAILLDALDRAARRGTLIQAVPPGSSADETVYFLNSPRGRAAMQALLKGEWTPGSQAHVQAALELERPNIFKLYEENIGPLTPLISDALREAEQTYPPEWIVEAFQKAVHANARSWRYIETILNTWKEKGRDASHRRDDQKDSRRYIEGELSDFIER